MASRDINQQPTQDIRLGPADGSLDQTLHIQSAIDRVHEQGGGCVVLSAGTYHAAAVRLHSHVRFHLDAGAILKGLADSTSYDRLGPRVGVLYAQDAQNFAITGSGVIDGSGVDFVDKGTLKHPIDCRPRSTAQGDDRFTQSTTVPDGPYQPRPERPSNTVIIHRCKDVRISGVTFQDGAFWTLHIGASDDIIVDGIVIENPEPVPNNDGIHVSGSRNVVITNAIIDACDDAIAITGIQEEEHFEDAAPGGERPTENVVVSNCVLRSRSSAIRIGYGRCDTRHIVCSNMVIYDSNRGIEICARHEGSVRDVRISNVIVTTRFHAGLWWGLGEGIRLSALPDNPKRSCGVIEGVSLDGMRITAENGLVFHAEKSGMCRDVHVQNIQLHVPKSSLSDTRAGNLDLRPIAHDPDRAVFEARRSAILCHGLQQSSFRDIRIRMDESLPTCWAHAFDAIGCKELEVDRVVTVDNLPAHITEAIHRSA